MGVIDRFCLYNFFVFYFYLFFMRDRIGSFLFGKSSSCEPFFSLLLFNYAAYYCMWSFCGMAFKVDIGGGEGYMCVDRKSSNQSGSEAALDTDDG